GSLAEQFYPYELAALVEHALLNNLICSPQYGLWDGKPKGFRGPEVYHELQLGRLLDGQLTGLCAIQNLRDLSSRTPKYIERTRTIGDKGTAQGVGPTDQGESALYREFGDPESVRREQQARHQDDTASTLASYRCERRFEFIRITHLDEARP